MGRPKGGYRNAQGQAVPGVTTIISRFKESDALLQWAFKQGKAAERGEIEHLFEKRDEAADIGNQVHEIIEKYHKGGSWKPLPFNIFEINAQRNVAVNNAMEAYLKWESITKLKILYQEVSLVSEEHQYGGTLDAIGEIDGEICLIDWKASNGVYVDYLIQLGAYKMLWNEWANISHGEFKTDQAQVGHITGGAHLCRFSKSHGDFSHHYWKDLDEACEQFLLFRKAYDLDKSLKQRVG